MSDLAITVQKIDSIKPHPHADRLEIIQILGTQCVEQIGKYKVGQNVIYFPPGMLLPPNVATELGVTKYLKHARWDGEKIQCRVGACRLRTEPSYGFIVPLYVNWELGADVTCIYEARQYEPPPLPGDQAQPHDDFNCYTDIANYWQYPDAIQEGTMVRITEKLHGTNSRVGVVQIDGEWQFIAGSLNFCWERPSQYWSPLESANVLRMLSFLCDEQHPVAIYGEIFGPGIQDMDYGLDYRSYRVFDIKVAGQFLPFDDLEDACNFWKVPMVPLLFQGPFSKDLVGKFTCGESALCDPAHIRSKFKGREGIVITPLQEEWSEQLLGRLILKSLSVDYLDRKGAQDNA